MKYYSTRDKNVSLSAAEAVKMGLSRDGGLLTPMQIPQIDRAFLERLIPMEYAQRAAKVMALYLTDYSEEELLTFGRNAYGPAQFDDPIAAPVRKVEHFDTTQAKLCMLFTLGRPMQPEQLAAVRLAMALYGGSVTSRLFLNVRERDHLCYYCSSSFQSFTGSMAVNSGVEHADAARAEQAVLKELADLCDGPITDEELEDCRRGLLAGMNGLEDTLGGIETWYYMEVLRGGPVQTPDDARRALLAVTREDVRDILKQFTLSVSCLLTREEGNENG